MKRELSKFLMMIDVDPHKNPYPTQCSIPCWSHFDEGNFIYFSLPPCSFRVWWAFVKWYLHFYDENMAFEKMKEKNLQQHSFYILSLISGVGWCGKVEISFYFTYFPSRFDVERKCQKKKTLCEWHKVIFLCTFLGFSFAWKSL